MNLPSLSMNQKLQELMKTSVRQEHSLWGLKGLSPKSYADLAANWQGLNFYRQLFDGPKPFIQCLDGKYKKHPHVKFKISSYIDELWNESFNCPSFLSDTDLDRFHSNLNKMGMSCPRDQHTCQGLIQKHSNDPLFLRYAVSPLCSNDSKTFRAVERAELITWSEVGLSLRGFTWSIIRDLALQKGVEFFKKLRRRYAFEHREQDPFLGEGRSVFEKLKRCQFAEPNEKKQCLEKYTDKNLTASQLNKFSVLVDQPIEMSTLDYCPQDSNALEALLHPKPIGDISLCFKTNYKDFETLGRVYFRHKSDGLKIVLLRY